jgi:hypothetical protein
VKLNAATGRGVGKAANGADEFDTADGNPSAAGSNAAHHAISTTPDGEPPAPGTITATISPERPVVGVSEVRIRGQATAGREMVDTSTFPDGIAHVFAITVSGAGNYTDGPFVLRQLGTYHDVLLDAATGARTEISYQGVGDFSSSVDHTSATVARGEEANLK